MLVRDGLVGALQPALALGLGNIAMPRRIGMDEECFAGRFLTFFNAVGFRWRDSANDDWRLGLIACLSLYLAGLLALQSLSLPTRSLFCATISLTEVRQLLYLNVVEIFSTKT